MNKCQWLLYLFDLMSVYSGKLTKKYQNLSAEPSFNRYVSQSAHLCNFMIVETVLPGIIQKLFCDSQPSRWSSMKHTSWYSLPFIIPSHTELWLALCENYMAAVTVCVTSEVIS